MTMTTAWWAVLLCTVMGAAQNSKAPVLACHLQAIRAADRLRYHDLNKRLRTALQERSELPDGYAFHLDSQVMSLPELAEWISLERLCCPFFSFQLTVSGTQTGWLLKLTGPEGVKALLQTEFPAG